MGGQEEEVIDHNLSWSDTERKKNKKSYEPQGINKPSAL
jgi:hypothetical protein